MAETVSTPWADDAEFDLLLPEAAQRVSRRFWTPLAVALRATELLVAQGARRVLDVGSGSGKFALVAAKAAPQLQIVGVEQRAHLVETAERAKRSLGIENVRFVVGDATAFSWASFDGFYFFNPFAENLFEPDEQLDADVELSMKRLALHVTRTERALRQTTLGTTVVTYHGCSGRIPACFDLASVEPAGSAVLRTWVKRRESSEDGAFFVEEGEEVTLHSPAASK